MERSNIVAQLHSVFGSEKWMVEIYDFSEGSCRDMDWLEVFCEAVA